MTRLQHNRNWKIEVFGREHGVPHFHLRWPDGRATLDIETFVNNHWQSTGADSRRGPQMVAGKQTANFGRVGQTQPEIVV